MQSNSMHFEELFSSLVCSTRDSCFLSFSPFTKWRNRDKRVKIVERVDMDNLAFYIQSLEISEEFRYMDTVAGYMEKKIYVC